MLGQAHSVRDPSRDPSRRMWKHAANNHHHSDHRRVCGLRMAEPIQCQCCSLESGSPPCFPRDTCITPYAWHTLISVVGAVKCEVHGVQYQMITNQHFYDSFALAHPAIAERCKITMFFSFKPYWVQSPDARSCMCIHHMNFYFMHDAYSSMMKKLHDPSGSGNCSCDFGDGSEPFGFRSTLVEGLDDNHSGTYPRVLGVPGAALSPKDV